MEHDLLCNRLFVSGKPIELPIEERRYPQCLRVRADGRADRGDHAGHGEIALLDHRRRDDEAVVRCSVQGGLPDLAQSLREVVGYISG